MAACRLIRYQATFKALQEAECSHYYEPWSRRSPHSIRPCSPCRTKFRVTAAHRLSGTFLQGRIISQLKKKVNYLPSINIIRFPRRSLPLQMRKNAKIYVSTGTGRRYLRANPNTIVQFSGRISFPGRLSFVLYHIFEAFRASLKKYYHKEGRGP